MLDICAITISDHLVVIKPNGSMESLRNFNSNTFIVRDIKTPSTSENTPESVPVLWNQHQLQNLSHSRDSVISTNRTTQS